MIKEILKTFHARGKEENFGLVLKGTNEAAPKGFKITQARSDGAQARHTREETMLDKKRKRSINNAESNPKNKQLTSMTL